MWYVTKHTIVCMYAAVQFKALNIKTVDGFGVHKWCGLCV